MRIAHVCPYDWNAAGGVREHVRHLSAEHRTMGHDTTVVAPRSHDGADDPDVTLIPTRIIGVPGARATARVAVGPGVWKDVGQLLRRGRFDIVHLHEPMVPLVCLAALEQADCPVVGTIHGYRPSYWPYRTLRAPLDRLMNRLDARIAVSSDARAWAGQYFPGHYDVIPDGVDVARFAAPVRPMERFNDGRPNVLFVGRLDPRKGFSTLLDAFALIRQRGVPARLIVVGGYRASEAKRLRREIAARGIDGVEFVGHVTDEDLPRYYRTADVFCSPATGYEALGIVLLEAMAAGTPMVASDIVGYRTVVRNRVEALTVQPRDAPALARAITEVITDVGLRNGLVANGQRRVRHYAWPVIARRIMTVYESVVRGGQRAPERMILEEVVDIVHDVLGVALAGIDVTRPIHDLGIDSLDLAAVSSRLYERTGVEIDDGDLISVRTISDLALILEAGSEPATTPAKDVPE